MFANWITKKEYRWQRHLAFWIFVIVSYGWVYFANDRLNKFWYDAVVLLPLDIILTYINAYWLVSRFLLEKKFFKFILGFIFVLVVYSILHRTIRVLVIYPHYELEGPPRKIFNFTGMYYNALMTYTFVFLFTGIQLFKKWFENDRQRQALVEQNLKSELSLLQSQINPHFLFNTLNNIDTLIFRSPDVASESIGKLSEIMRYMLYETNEQVVSLEKEIEYLEGMITLIALRMQPNAIQFHHLGEKKGKYLPPMLLVPFIENAYKHGVKKGNTSLIDIELKVLDNRCLFSVQNQIESNINGKKDRVGGIGLTNVKRRLELIYQTDYELKISQLNGVYKVNLSFPWLKYDGNEDKLYHS